MKLGLLTLPVLFFSLVSVAQKFDVSKPEPSTFEFLNERKPIYTGQSITLHDVYPNPIVESALVAYLVHDARPSHRITVRNLLGNVVGELQLSATESTAKVNAEDLMPGIYFFTLSVDGEAVVTRKMMVRR